MLYRGRVQRAPLLPIAIALVSGLATGACHPAAPRVESSLDAATRSLLSVAAGRIELKGGVGELTYVADTTNNACFVVLQPDAGPTLSIAPLDCCATRNAVKASAAAWASSLTCPTLGALAAPDAAALAALYAPALPPSAALPPDAAAPTDATGPVAAPDSDDLASLIDRSVKKLDDTHYEIAKPLIEALLNNPMMLARTGRIIPAYVDGKPQGFKLYAIRRNTLFDRVGFSNGDTIRTVNGVELLSADKALDIYSRVRDAKVIEVAIVRRGKPITFSYTLK